MKTLINATDEICRDAVERFVAELGETGLTLEFCDGEAAATDRGQTAICLQWEGDENMDDENTDDGQWQEEEFEDPDCEADWSAGQTPGAGPSRIVEHYIKNLRFLAASPKAAETWLSQGHLAAEPADAEADMEAATSQP